jgi:hypothetical protein
LPVLGVAPFFLRKLLDLPTDNGETHHRRAFAFALLLGVAIDASFVLELFTSFAGLGWVRVAAAIAYVGDDDAAAR